MAVYNAEQDKRFEKFCVDRKSYQHRRPYQIVTVITATFPVLLQFWKVRPLFLYLYTEGYPCEFREKTGSKWLTPLQYYVHLISRT